MVNWGVIGTGMIVDMFCKDFNVVTGAALHSIYGRNKDKAESVAEKYGFARTFDDLDAFLAQPDLDVVYIGTPHNTHMTFTLKAIEAGKHVVCEKPFAVNSKETARMQQAAKEKGVFLMDALWTLYLPAIRKALEWIHSGVIGEVRLIEADFGQMLSTDPLGRIQNPQLAGGALLDVGIYPVLLSNAIMGTKPEHIDAHAIFTETGVDETTAITMKYKSAVASLSASIAVKTRWHATVYGTAGYIEIPEFFMAKEAILMADESEEFFADRSPGLGYQHEAQGVTDLIAGGAVESDVVTHAFTRDLIETLDTVRDRIGLKYPFE